MVRAGPGGDLPSGAVVPPSPPPILTLPPRALLPHGAGRHPGLEFALAVTTTLKAFLGLNTQSTPYAFAVAGLGRGTVALTILVGMTLYCCVSLVNAKDALVAAGALGAEAGAAEGQPTPSSAADTAAAATAGQYAALASPRPGEGGAVAPSDADCRRQGATPPSDGSVTADACPPPGGVSLQAVATAVFGPAGGWAVHAALMVTQLGFCTAHLIFLTNTLHAVVGGGGAGGGPPPWWYTLLPLPAVAALTLTPSVRSLGPAAAVANVALLAGVAAVAAAAATDGRPWSAAAVRGVPGGGALFWGQMTGALEGVGLVLPVEAAMRVRFRGGGGGGGGGGLWAPWGFGWALAVTLVGLGLLLGGLGVGAAGVYGAATEQIVLMNLRVGLRGARGGGGGGRSWRWRGMWLLGGWGGHSRGRPHSYGRGVGARGRGDTHAVYRPGGRRGRPADGPLWGRRMGEEGRRQAACAH